MAGGAPFQLTINGTDYLGAFAGGSATTAYVIPESISLSNDADGEGAQLSFEVIQEVTPGGGSWFSSLPDNAAVKFIDTTLAANTTLFAGFVGSVDVSLNGGGQGTIAKVECLAPSSLLDRIVVWKGVKSTIKGEVVSTITLPKGKTDKVLIQTILASYVAPRLGSGISDLFDPSITSGISSTATINEKVELTLGSLRSALDSIKELAQSIDGIERRYYIDAKLKRLVYGKVPVAGDYASAPFEIITAAIDNPAGGTATASTLSVRDLTVSYDHEASRKRVFVVAGDARADGDDSTDPYVRSYTDAGFSSRSGLVTDEVIDAPTIKGQVATSAGRTARKAKILNTARAYFTEHYKPVRTIEFSVRGAGTATGQTYGFGAGTAQTGASTYARVDRWEPGQFVKITSTPLDLSGLYRIEQVEMGFEAGSLIRTWKITAQRRRRGTLAQLVAGR